MRWTQTTPDWPVDFDDERSWTLSGHTLTVRRVGKDAVARVGEDLAQIPGLGDLSSLFDESQLAPEALGLVASPPTHYLLLTTSSDAPIPLEDVTCGAYDLSWFELSTGRQALGPRVELDGGDASLSPPDGLRGLLVVFLRRHGR